MKKKNIIRYSQADFEILQKHFKAAGENETQVFTLFSNAVSQKCNIYIANIQLIPDQNELQNQSPVSIEPLREFQATAYSLAYETGKSICDEHTHPFTQKPNFSSIDNHHGQKNAIYLSKYLPDSATMLMVVFGDGMKHFQAQVWNREESCFEPIDRLEVLGSPIQILEEDTIDGVCVNDPYARHRIIPGWIQDLLGKIKVFVVGLSGNGSLALQGLVALGVGKSTGWIKCCDHDELEASNLPRIPYAYEKDIGKPKAEIAEAYARNKDADINVSCYNEPIESQRMLNYVKEANVILDCVDRDGPRKIINRYSVRYGIPLVSIGSEIIPEKDSYEAIGQIRVVNPGKTGCMMCSGMIDPSEAVLDLLPEDIQNQRAKAGYIRGSDQTPTPSVLHLNGVTSNLAISQFLRLVFGEDLSGKEFMHYDRQSCNILTASIPPDPDCPVCGTKGYLAAGDEEFEYKAIINDKSIGRFELRDGKVIEQSHEESSNPETNAQDNNENKKNANRTNSD
ncbi:ThiF family adenylyltransferase [Planctomycetota bacterium]